MRQEYQEYEGKTWRRVTSKIAQKAFMLHRDVLILPALVRFDNMWITPFKIKKSDANTYFKKIIDEYAYYNCSHELGTYCKYYVMDK